VHSLHFLSRRKVFYLFPSPEVARIDEMVHLHSRELILLNVVTKAIPVSYIENDNGVPRHLIFAFLETLEDRFAEDLSLTETRRSLSARLDDPLAWDRRSVLVGCKLQTTPRQLIEIDNSEPRLGGSLRQGLHSVERCPGAPEPVARAPATPVPVSLAIRVPGCCPIRVPLIDR